MNTRGEFGIGETESGSHNTIFRLPFEVDFETEDVVIKLDLIGDEISGSAWRADDEPVEMPLASFTNKILKTGTVGTTILPYDGTASVEYHWMEVAEVLPGDINTNDVFDVHDVNLLTSAIRDRFDGNRYDVNRDGLVARDDRTTLLEDILNFQESPKKLHDRHRRRETK